MKINASVAACVCVCVYLKVSQDIYQLIRSLNSYVMDPYWSHQSQIAIWKKKKKEMCVAFLH